jgi:hypothetical protein
VLGVLSVEPRGVCSSWKGDLVVVAWRPAATTVSALSFFVSALELGPCDDFIDDLGQKAEGGLKVTIPTRILPIRQPPEYRLVGPSSLS